ncbi:MAG: hypothetical protein HY744_15210 [Deltaproteobacteria bacterium]|nr:hypothetical protein [Deltaproteobacteria bacterium]
MRILRVRRGYTTNSSGAYEWLPIDGGRDAAAPGASGAASARAAASVSAARTAPDAGAAPSAAASACASAVPEAPGAGNGPAGPDHTASNLWGMGVLAGVVVLFVAFWAVMKKALAGGKQDRDG